MSKENASISVVTVARQELRGIVTITLLLGATGLCVMTDIQFINVPLHSETLILHTVEVLLIDRLADESTYVSLNVVLSPL